MPTIIGISKKAVPNIPRLQTLKRCGTMHELVEKLCQMYQDSRNQKDMATMKKFLEKLCQTDQDCRH